MRAPSAGRPGEAGQSLVSAVAGVGVFLAFLLFAVHLIVSLYATTTVTSNAYDAARQVASAEIDHSDPAQVARARARAEADLRSNLGGYADRIESLDWSGSDAGTVRLRVRAENPSLLVFATRPLGVEHIDRTVVVRVERVR